MPRPKVTESFRDQMRGFPFSQILLICLVRFAEPIAFTSLFPYVYFMVKDFGIAKTEAEIAKYSGYLSSTFAFCQFLTSYNWGRFADRHGRKPTLLIGLTGSICSLLTLGFAKNYYWALAARSIMGLLNGNVAVIRTMIGEVATERKHQALAFSTMPLIFQVGCVIGPMLGGYLSGKESRFAALRPLAEAFPYALPNIVVSSLLFTSMIVAIFFLEETHYKHKYRRDYFVEIGDFLKKVLFGVETKVRPWQSRKENVDSVDEETALIDDDNENQAQNYDGTNNDSDSSIQSVPNMISRRTSKALIRAYSLHEEGDIEEDKESWKALLTPHIFYAVVCNFIMSLHLTVHDEFLPIFLAYDVAKDKAGNLISKFPFKIVGGLNYTSEDTGRLLSSTGMLGIFVILVVFPYVDRHYESLPTYKRFIRIFPVTYTLTPFLVFLADHKTASMVICYVFTCFKTLATSISFPQILLIVHNSSPAKHRAMINGATISISALARCAGPLIWGYIFSWAQEYQIAWAGWWSLTVLALLAIYQSRYLRESSDEDEEENQTQSLQNDSTE
ncbi:hypothetical protein WICMUC_003561 [Wickerhamomyces mucosus]|uniref:Major facilitator superfamily (MFS) profile domain-containing protein n=1 Tax=Wickerhamomyces mucosus TaxID=1378264 RepID=A0A9P8PK64_9ASCO|nr:hypothetical protein WICMUC_003561 [Wickerhamomyces mucosus]